MVKWLKLLEPEPDNFLPLFEILTPLVKKLPSRFVLTMVTGGLVVVTGGFVVDRAGFRLKKLGFELTKGLRVVLHFPGKSNNGLQ